MKILPQSFSLTLGVILTSLMVFSAGCGKSPEEARKELGALAIKYDSNSFIESVDNSDIVAVKLFLEAGMNADAKNDAGETALQAAVIEGHADIVKLLIKHDANVNAASDTGSVTPLHYAAGNGHADIVKLLIDHGADINVKDGGGYTPLRRADFADHPEVAKLLKAAGAKE